MVVLNFSSYLEVGCKITMVDMGFNIAESNIKQNKKFHSFR